MSSFHDVFKLAKIPSVYLLERYHQHKAPAGHPAEMPSQGQKLDQLPIEVLNLIFARVPFHPVIFLNLKLVCKSFHRIIDPRKSFDLFRSVASISYPDVSAAFLSVSAMPNLASLIVLRQYHDAAQILTDMIMDHVHNDFDCPSGGYECEDTAKCYADSGESDKGGTIRKLRSMVFRGLLTWKKIRMVSMADGNSPREVVLDGHPHISNTTQLLIRFVSAALGYAMSKIIDKANISPAIMDDNNDFDRSVYGNRYNLTLAYDAYRPPLTWAIDGMLGGDDDSYEGIYSDQRLSRISRAFSMLCAASCFEVSFIEHLEDAKDLPPEMKLDSWMFDREGFHGQNSASNFFPHHRVRNMQHLVRVMVEADPKYKENNKLSVLAMKQHELDMYDCEECEGGPDCILVAVKSLEEKENPSKEEKMNVAHKFNVDMILDLNLLNPRSPVREMMGPSETIFAKALEDLNRWLASTEFDPEKDEEIDDEAEYKDFDEDMFMEVFDGENMNDDEDTDEKMDDDADYEDTDEEMTDEDDDGEPDE